jgi:hypothetical protein
VNEEKGKNRKESRVIQECGECTCSTANSSIFTIMSAYEVDPTQRFLRSQNFRWVMLFCKYANSPDMKELKGRREFVHISGLGPIPASRGGSNLE